MTLIIWLWLLVTNRDEDIILHYYKNSHKRRRLANLLGSEQNSKTTPESYENLFMKLVYEIAYETSPEDTQVLVLSNARSEICTAAEAMNLEWMGIQAFPPNLPHG